MSRRERQKRRKRNRGRPVRRTVLVIVTLLLLGAAGAAAVGASWVMGVVDDTPDIAQIRPKPAGAISTVYASDGTRLGFIAGGDTLRTPVDGTKIPPLLKKATVAIEDKRFYKHRGVDYTGVLRAAVKNVTDRTSQGGSTLTMQLVRNLYIPENRYRKNFTRKIREAKLADELEKQHSKEWILVSYLNNVPYTTVGGQEAVGVQASARVLFDKDVSKLNLAESALLAGLPQAPSSYNPFDRPEKARERRADVLKAMVDSRYISQAEADEAAAAPLGVKSNVFYQQRKEPFVFDYVREQLIKKYGAEVLRAGGLRVYTTIDIAKQDAARAAIRSVLYDPADPPAAIATVDPANGHILAMASSAVYGDEKDGKTNYNYAATAQRQPGSTFKTMVLMAAIRKGIDPDSTYYTSKKLEAGWLPSDPTYEVSTFGHTYAGSESITRATLSSDNTVYAQLDADVTPEAVRQAAYDMGITSRLDAYPAEGLGGLTNGVTVLEMANAYATIANGGIRRTTTIFTRVKLANGQIDDLGRTRSKRTFTPAQAEKARSVLEQNVQSGTGVSAGYGCPAGGKTGTTSDIKDAWFVGFTPKLATAVWMGYKTPTPMVVHGMSVQGGTFPAPIWHEYMSVASDGYCGADWPEGGSFESQPFFGRYASTGKDEDDDYSYDGDSSDDGTTDPSTDGTDGTTDDGATGTDGTNPDPGAYARPPQGEPEIQTPDGGDGTEGGGAGAPTGN